MQICGLLNMQFYFFLACLRNAFFISLLFSSSIDLRKEVCLSLWIYQFISEIFTSVFFLWDSKRYYLGTSKIHVSSGLYLLSVGNIFFIPLLDFQFEFFSMLYIGFISIFNFFLLAFVLRIIFHLLIFLCYFIIRYVSC